MARFVRIQLPLNSFPLAHGAVLGSYFAKKPHFILSMFKYVKQEYRSLLIGSSRPELVWDYAASVGAACEIMMVLEFGVEATPSSSVSDNISIHSVRCIPAHRRDHMIMELVTKLIEGSLEMAYVICECFILLYEE